MFLFPIVLLFETFSVLSVFTHVHVFSSHFVLLGFAFFCLSSFPSQWVTKGIFRSVNFLLRQSKILLLCNVYALVAPETDFLFTRFGSDF